MSCLSRHRWMCLEMRECTGAGGAGIRSSDWSVWSEVKSRFTAVVRERGTVCGRQLREWERKHNRFELLQLYVRMTADEVKIRSSSLPPSLIPSLPLSCVSAEQQPLPGELSLSHFCAPARHWSPRNAWECSWKDLKNKHIQNVWVNCVYFSIHCEENTQL